MASLPQTMCQCPKVFHPCIWDRKLPYRGSGNFALFLHYCSLWVDPMKIQPRQPAMSSPDLAAYERYRAVPAIPRLKHPLLFTVRFKSLPRCRLARPTADQPLRSSGFCRDTRTSKPRGGCQWSAEAVVNFEEILSVMHKGTKYRRREWALGSASRMRRYRIDPDRIYIHHSAQLRLTRYAY